jgi:hypothetical protein
VKKVRLGQIAIARSGDKGSGSNVGLIARSPQSWDFLREHLSADRVKAHFGSVVRGPVTRYELPNLRALNFILEDSLGGGGSETLHNDAQGKTHGQALLRMELEVPDDLPVGEDGP